MIANMGTVQSPQKTGSSRVDRARRSGFFTLSSVAAFLCLVAGAVAFVVASADVPGLWILFLAVPAVAALFGFLSGEFRFSIPNIGRCYFVVLLRLVFELCILFITVPWVVLQLLWRLAWAAVAVCAGSILIIVVYHGLRLCGIEWRYPDPRMTTPGVFLGFSLALVVSIALALTGNKLCSEKSSDRFFEMVADFLLDLFDGVKGKLGP